MTRDTYDKILAILHQEVKPALGCTEPIAVALATAKAASLLKDKEITSVKVKVSPNILKNAMGVGIPGTDQTGLPVAIALAICCGKPEYGLEVLREVNDESVRKAKEILPIVSVMLSDSPKMLYAEVECVSADSHVAKCRVEDAHDHIAFLALDGKVLVNDSQRESSEEKVSLSGEFLKLSLIHEFGEIADIRDLELMREEILMNTALAEEGLKGHYGLEVGRTISSGSHKDIYGDTAVSYAMSMTAAASDARMAGCPLPAMSNSGSGNQGITVSIPVIAAARMLNSTEEELIRALAVSNLVAIHIKSYLGKLSALCGCVVASTGSSCGIITLKGGGVKEMAAAIKNMIGNITGMVCDGAKKGCALKVASGVSCAIQSAVLACDGICIQSTDGIIDEDVEKTICNLGAIGAKSMKETDRMILGIMTGKN